MSRHAESTALIAASPGDVFAHLDDQERLAAHMTRSSMMMGGGRMTYEFDAHKGKAVGSHIKMGGSAFGISLFVDEVVTVREPPRRKMWKTVGHTRLIVIGPYEMGYAVDGRSGGSELRVWIDYEPPRGWARFIPWLGSMYARWCVGRMTADAAGRFGRISAMAPGLS